MARIFGLFTWKGAEQSGTRGENASPVGADRDIDPGSALQASAPFERLGQSHQLIDSEIGAAVDDLAVMADLQQRLAMLRADVARAFDQHRKLAITNVSLERDRDRLSAALSERTSAYDAALAELGLLRGDYDGLRQVHDQLSVDFENLDIRHHAAAAARKDLEDRLQVSLTDNAALLDENETLRVQTRLLADTADSNQLRVVELSERLNEVEAKLLHASNQHETTELALQERTEELSNARALLDVALQERESATDYARLKEQEVSQLRIDQARLLQRFQQERQNRETETAQLRSELETLRTSSRSYEEIASVARVKAERLGIELKRLEERNAALEGASERLDARLTRLSSKLEATTAAKQQIEQSRTAISARLEAANQLLAEREMIAKRLEAKLESVTEKTSQASVLQQDKIDELSSRVFELESELTERRNELALYESQMNVIQANTRRAKRRD